MPKSTRKVYAYLTCGESLLVFIHTEYPEAGVQVPGGTVHPGESLEAGVLRETHEETGLTNLEICRFLGKDELILEQDGEKLVLERNFFHLTTQEKVASTWRHWEQDPSGGEERPIEFEFYWADLSSATPELSGRQDVFFRELRVSLRLNPEDQSISPI